MYIPESLHEYKNMLYNIAKLAALEVLKETGAIKPDISLREAQRLYGAGTVKRWKKEGLISFRKDGNQSSKIRIDRGEIEAVRLASNRCTYLSTEERNKK